MIDYSIIGKRFGNLTVISLDHITTNHNTYWLCRCDCGNEKVVYRGGLTSGDIISCGCYHKEHLNEYGKTHGLSNDKMYSKWSGMMQRCTNPKASNYERYGGRGIDICDDWRNNPEHFIEWAYSNGYEDGLTLDRKNNNKGYYPDNCRWITTREQQSNTRRNHNITRKGITHSIAEWSKLTGVNHETLRYRVNHNNFDDIDEYLNKED